MNRLRQRIQLVGLLIKHLITYSYKSPCHSEYSLHQNYLTLLLQQTTYKTDLYSHLNGELIKKLPAVAGLRLTISGLGVPGLPGTIAGNGDLLIKTPG